MKKLVLLIILITLITGCIIKKDKINIKSENNLTLSLKENTLTNTSATFILKNNSNIDYSYGPEYYLEYEENGIWSEIKLDEPLTWNSIAYILKTNESKEININWSTAYGYLQDGHYRLVKKLIKEENNVNNSNIIYLDAEFYILENEVKKLEIVKSNFQDTNKYNIYLEKGNKIIYLASNIEEIYYIEGNSKITLKKYFSKSYQTDNDVLKHLIELMELVDTLKDGGTTIYKSKKYDVTMINCNTLSGNRDIFVGDYNMLFDNNLMCKRNS